MQAEMEVQEQREDNTWMAFVAAASLAFALADVFCDVCIDGSAEETARSADSQQQLPRFLI
jgi:hypothetical protein